VVCLARRDPVDIAGPPRLSDVGARPLNFTVRGTCSGAKFQAPPLRLASKSLRCRGAWVGHPLPRLNSAPRPDEKRCGGAPLRKR